MRKIGIIGLGHVGATVAYTLFTHGIADELVLIDKNDDKVTAEYNDLRDALAVNNYYVQIKMQDWDALKDADVIVTAFGDVSETVKATDRFAEFKSNAKKAKKVGHKIKKSGFKGVLLNISDPCDAITAILQKSSDLKKNRVFGTGTYLGTARMQRIIGEKLGQNPVNVEGFVLGENGSTQFVAWSTVRVNNKIALQLFNEDDQKKISDKPNENSFAVAKGKGYTCYAIATCAVRLIQAVFSDARLYASVSAYDPEYKTYIGYPAIIGSDGIEQLVELKLTEDEHNKLTASANKIKKHLKELKK
ncbi:lactate/malate family dehydrogenase [Lactobacillus acetotolerans]|jgi:L-lactate dehydrogenase|uniref:L-2-hydroxyisocaproate dehydrogenase n=1 Tax=Lactobacillus acetotolerans TaxID=1600 RepID=A0A0D6A353_9LACO|nr:NAD(P)-binding domain-containing protein [Lactobacillus acetotolerans]KRN39803.1 L-2-hydroxyisocaproate dehydrogenase [Lactobacillus acetotolerans DSM 20749 = JCM 3825]QFG51028.1 L-lactate dehydrogenase [Lactobacillus acetotolerans]QGV04864.1 L-lactate dehydrogenase [Lactobacillus acetotolerans]QJD73769.1 NAD(P)-binding domain-containing protein [Lactobacillus acetotolerans]BAQ56955.1 L-2-hydroxyisocaproate dehydrogenase [Lactobacillus acetotolerans]